MFISICKNITRSISSFICHLFNRICTAECISAFQIKCTSVSGMKVASARRGGWFLPRLYSSTRFTRSRDACFALSSFFPFFFVWEYIYSTSGVPEKHGRLRAWPSFCHSLWAPLHFFLSFFVFLPTFSVLNFSAQCPFTYYLRAKHSYCIV